MRRVYKHSSRFGSAVDGIVLFKGCANAHSLFLLYPSPSTILSPLTFHIYLRIYVQNTEQGWILLPEFVFVSRCLLLFTRMSSVLVCDPRQKRHSCFFFSFRPADVYETCACDNCGHENNFGGDLYTANWGEVVIKEKWIRL